MVPSNAPAKTGKFFFLYTISRKNTFSKKYFLKFFQFKFHDCQTPRAIHPLWNLGKLRVDIKIKTGKKFQQV